MIFLSEREVTRFLPIDDVLTALEEAFAAQAQDAIRMPLRTIAPGSGGLLGAMPASIMRSPKALGAKLVTVFHDNAARGMPTHQALIALFDAASGQPLAIMDGRFITEIRTAATSALATKALARPDAKALAILGTGVQARAHIEALAQVMNIADLRIWGRTPASAAAVVASVRALGHEAAVAPSVAAACRGADVICTLTAAHDPILSADDVEAGAHVNAVGFGGFDGREVSGDLVGCARLFVDSLEGARHESGAIRLAIREGRLPEEPELTRLCDVIAGSAAGRRSHEDTTLFVSLGIAIEDVACARLVYERAVAAGAGTSVAL
jgi:ornithine cyclodeaminase/alanine dehydrogenase-like protein (mu-crystallin family)